MKYFKGDCGFIHQWEGHMGRPYVPGKPQDSASGITLDPGADLGHVDRKLFEQTYGPILTPAQLQACRGAYGLTRQAAHNYLRDNAVIKTIRVSREFAKQAFPLVAEPYWRGALQRFPGLKRPDVPSSVHTAILSLLYNRGIWNRQPEFSVVAECIKSGDWKRLGETIRAMQQGHKLQGIRNRRRAEGELILQQLNSQDEWVDNQPKMPPEPPEKL